MVGDVLVTVVVAGNRHLLQDEEADGVAGTTKEQEPAVEIVHEQ